MVIKCLKFFFWSIRPKYVVFVDRQRTILTSYSSESSSLTIGLPAPPAADCDEEERIGPDSFRNDDKRPPTPPDEPADADESSVRSSESVSALAFPPAPALKLNPPAPPDDEPLSAPNFEVIAAILGEITAWMRLCKLVIGFGASMPYCLFLATFVWSSDVIRRVLASRILSIFYDCIDNKI